MPEGDSVFKLVAYLRPALLGQRLHAASMVKGWDADIRGREVSDVFAHGKHLFFELDRRYLLRSHLGMRGSWHAYASHEPWLKPASQASVVLATDDRRFVCFNALQVEILRSNGVRRRQIEQRLGPDLLDPKPLFDDMVGRVRRLIAGDTPLVDLLLDQRIATGIGNVFKSETLFVARHHPLLRVDALDDAHLLALFEQASVLMKQNVRQGPRVTRRARDEASRLWVYGRTHQPCLNCEDRIVSARLGRNRRSTFWCPSCQPTFDAAVASDDATS